MWTQTRERSQNAFLYLEHAKLGILKVKCDSINSKSLNSFILGMPKYRGDMPEKTFNNCV